ncbi:hypothetical protein [Dyadobacter sp. 3J3]|uniref:hypothetical protein n=1 Tax=Dyadobacter sp. 3J3 TaxID=2606600 RepID=UPI00135BFF30|nr:hypothetical protein [Dyadobacter sp. 3J3]
MAKNRRNTSLKLSGEQIVNKKLKEMNELLRGVDLSNLPKKPNSNPDCYENKEN